MKPQQKIVRDVKSMKVKDQGIDTERLIQITQR